MCSPVAIPMAIAAAGAIASTMATRAAVQQQNRTADYNTSVTKYEAADAINRGKVEENLHRQKVQRLIGAQRAAFGASGAKVDSGSSLDVISDTARFGEMDALAIRANAKREAWAKRNQANLYQMSKSSTMMATMGSALTGLSSVASAYGSYGGSGGSAGGAKMS
jgi:hypothetical protein